jgi:hypothetical protein
MVRVLFAASIGRSVSNRDNSNGRLIHQSSMRLPMLSKQFQRFGNTPTPESNPLSIPGSLPVTLDPIAHVHTCRVLLEVYTSVRGTLQCLYPDCNTLFFLFAPPEITPTTLTRSSKPPTPSFPAAAMDLNQGEADNQSHTGSEQTCASQGSQAAKLVLL